MYLLAENHPREYQIPEHFTGTQKEDINSIHHRSLS